MPLSGLNRPSAKPRGGVAKVELVPASEYAGTASARGPAQDFREDRAHYSETPARESPLAPLTKHTLVMELPATAESRRATGELAAISAAEGVAAVVTLASGEVIVAGYSARFGTRYPLRVTKIESVSGRTPADFPTITVTLESVDADAAGNL